MEDNLDKKLIFLLRHQLKDEESIKKIINLIMIHKISNVLITYLYNYLYKNSSNEIINIDYSDGKFIVREMNKKEKDNLYKFEVIEPESKLSDIKRTNIMININEETKETKVKKQLHYALDSAIDLMILETSEYMLKHHVNFNDAISALVQTNEYKRISYLSLKNPTLRVYESAQMIDGTIKIYNTILEKDRLKEYNSKIQGNIIPPENLTEYTKKSIKYLKQLYNIEKEKFLNDFITNTSDKVFNYIDLDDADIINFFESLNNNTNTR